jgi:hypothetical protein
METEYILSQKYVDLGFKMSRFGRESLALKCQDKVVFVFSSGLDVRADFVSRLCDCHLKLTSDKSASQNIPVILLPAKASVSALG